MADPREAGPPNQPTGGAPTIYVDGVAREAPGADVTGSMILALVGKSADRFDLYAKGHHGLRLGPEEPVEVHDGAQFETRPRP